MQAVSEHRPPASPDDLLDTDQAMMVSGLKRNMFFNLRKWGIIKPVNEDRRLNRPAKLLFRRDDIEATRDLTRADIERLRKEAGAGEG